MVLVSRRVKSLDDYPPSKKTQLHVIVKICQHKNRELHQRIILRVEDFMELFGLLSSHTYFNNPLSSVVASAVNVGEPLKVKGKKLFFSHYRCPKFISIKASLCIGSI